MNQFDRLFFPFDQKADHFKFLDGLRGLAVLMVALAHCSNPNTNIHLAEWLNFKAIGQSGVFLFFFLSSYLLDRQIAIGMISNKATPMFWLNYFSRRFLRIFPLFTFSLFLNATLRFLGIGFSLPIDLSDIVPHLLLIEAKGIYWSIPVEFKYYFISPIIMLSLKLLTNWRTNYVLIYSVLLITFCSIIATNIEFSRISLIKYLPVFLVGSIMSVLELQKHEELSTIPTKYYKTIDFCGILSIVLILVLSGSYFYDFIFKNRNLFNIVRNQYIWIALLYAILLFSAKYGRGVIKDFLCFKPLRFIGIVSFSFYLFHMPILRVFKTLKGYIPDPLIIILFIIASVTFSSVTFLLIEKPLSKIKLI